MLEVWAEPVGGGERTKIAEAKTSGDALAFRTVEAMREAGYQYVKSGDEAGVIVAEATSGDFQLTVRDTERDEPLRYVVEEYRRRFFETWVQGTPMAGNHREATAKKAASRRKAPSPDIPYERYATTEFLRVVAAIEENKTLNMYVDEAIKKRVSSAELEKEIKRAIKMHSKYDKQPGSSPLHGAVAIAMWNLLAALRQSVLGGEV